jgi:hypothetical protein
MAIDNTSPSPARKPLAVAVLTILYPFVIVGLMWFVIASFEDEDAPFLGVALIAVFVMGNVLMNALLVYYRHKTRERWIRAEAAPSKFIVWSCARERGGLGTQDFQ